MRLAGTVARFATLAALMRSPGHGLLFSGMTRPTGLLAHISVLRKRTDGCQEEKGTKSRETTPHFTSFAGHRQGPGRAVSRRAPDGDAGCG